VPRYLYRCTSCDTESTIFHLSDERADNCPQCDAPETLIKSLTPFTTAGSKTRKTRTGDTTEEFIKDARQELNKQKEKLEDKR
jgi:putative FmdB family regulatory protein